jgi:hypothetical protein
VATKTNTREREDSDFLGIHRREFKSVYNRKICTPIFIMALVKITNL